MACELTYSQALREALTEEMMRDPNILLMGEDIGVYGGVFKVTEGLMAKFGPERVRETPISEAGFVGMGVGLAMTGKRPVCELMFMDFAFVASDQIFNQAAKMRYMSGGGARCRADPHAAGRRPRQRRTALPVPGNLLHPHPRPQVVMPATPYDAKGLLKTALREDNPVVFIEHKLLYSTKGGCRKGNIPSRSARPRSSGRARTSPSSPIRACCSSPSKPPSRPRARASRWRWSTCAHRAAGHGSDPGLGAEDEPADRRAGGHRSGGVASRRLADPGAGLRLPRRADRARGGMDIPIPSSKPLEDVVLPGPAQILAAIKQVVA